MKQSWKTRVEELESLFGGRKILLDELNLTPQSFSMWKHIGIPENQMFRIAVTAEKRDVTLPEWFFSDFTRDRGKNKEKVPA